VLGNQLAPRSGVPDAVVVGATTAVSHLQSRPQAR
jgi:hypothetical protein